MGVDVPVRVLRWWRGGAGRGGEGGRLDRVDVRIMNGVLACRVARTDVVGRSVISASLGE